MRVEVLRSRAVPFIYTFRSLIQESGKKGSHSLYEICTNKTIVSVIHYDDYSDLDPRQGWKEGRVGAPQPV